MNLKNKVVLVTGASRGIGKATALAFSHEGCRVVINYFKEKKLAEALGQALSIQTDVADFSSFQNMVASIVKKLGRIDILVNNAGLIIQTNQDYQQITDEVWDRTMNVNLKGVFNGIKAVAPIMKKQGQGRIINTASVFGQTGAAAVMAYTAAKAGVENLTKAFAKELAPEITVNAVAPAVCNTDMTKGSGEELINFFKKNTPLQRIAQPEEIAQAIVFFAKSDFITGQILNVDGGYGLK